MINVLRNLISQINDVHVYVVFLTSNNVSIRAYLKHGGVIKKIWSGFSDQWKIAPNPNSVYMYIVLRKFKKFHFSAIRQYKEYSTTDIHVYYCCQ